MTLRDWQTGKGCCQDSIRGQLSLHGPVLNKVPINSPFISDRNQCTGDWVSQLTLSTAWAEEREEEKGTWAQGRGSKGNMGNDSRGWAAVSFSGLVFPLICREGGIHGARRPDSHQARGPRGPWLRTPWQKAEAAYLPGGSECVCVCVCVCNSGSGGGSGEAAAYTATPPSVHIIY